MHAPGVQCCAAIFCRNRDGVIGTQGGQYTVEGTLVSASHPDAVFALLSDFDSVADVFGSILDSRTTRDGGNLHLTQARGSGAPSRDARGLIA